MDIGLLGVVVFHFFHRLFVGEYFTTTTRRITDFYLAKTENSRDNIFKIGVKIDFVLLSELDYTAIIKRYYRQVGERPTVPICPINQHQ